MSSRVITVFGSGKADVREPSYESARRLGELLAQKGFTVCNGGYYGLMEASARGAGEAGGKTIGIVTPSIKKQPNPWIVEVVQAADWRERLFRLIAMGDGFVVCDGGTGTLTEFTVVWEMINLKIVKKPVVVLGKFYHDLLAVLEKNPFMVFNDYLKRCHNPEDAVAYLASVLS